MGNKIFAGIVSFFVFSGIGFGAGRGIHCSFPQWGPDEQVVVLKHMFGTSKSMPQQEIVKQLAGKLTGRTLKAIKYLIERNKNIFEQNPELFGEAKLLFGRRYRQIFERDVNTVRQMLGNNPEHPEEPQDRFHRQEIKATFKAVALYPDMPDHELVAKLIEDQILPERTQEEIESIIEKIRALEQSDAPLFHRLRLLSDPQKNRKEVLANLIQKRLEMSRIMNADRRAKINKKTPNSSNHRNRWQPMENANMLELAYDYRRASAEKIGEFFIDWSKIPENEMQSLGSRDASAVVKHNSFLNQASIRIFGCDCCKFIQNHRASEESPSVKVILNTHPDLRDFKNQEEASKYKKMPYVQILQEESNRKESKRKARHRLLSGAVRDSN